MTDRTAAGACEQRKREDGLPCLVPGGHGTGSSLTHCRTPLPITATAKYQEFVKPRRQDATISSSEKSTWPR